MWNQAHKEGWVLKNLHFWIVVLEKTLEISLDSKEIKQVSSKGNQPWLFTGRTDAEVETPILWLSDVKLQFIGKDCDVGNDWGQEKGVTGWDGWMASLTQWTWIWTNSGRYWRTGKPGMLQFMGSQRVWHGLATEQQQQQKPVRKLLNYKIKHAQDQKPSRLMSALTIKPLSQTCTPYPVLHFPPLQQFSYPKPINLKASQITSRMIPKMIGQNTGVGSLSLLQKW